MALNKEVPTILAKMRHGHPYISVVAAAIIYIVLIISRQSQTVVDLANVTAIVALIVVNLAAARSQRSSSHTGMKLPLGPTIPLLGAAGAFMQIFFMPLTSMLIGLGFALSGVIIYSLRVRFHKPGLHAELTSIAQTLKSPLLRALQR